MNIRIADNLSRFVYDCSRVTFAVLVIGVLAKKPFSAGDLIFGTIFTLLLAAGGATIDAVKEDES